ncbi:MAG: class I SAM-dependent methyltransferase [Pseudomonas sp.]
MQNTTGKALCPTHLWITSSDVAQRYLDHRPTYPPELFAWLAQQCKQHGLAWDCATGSGLAAVSLAPHFQSVVAKDASAAQIFAGKPHDQIVYRVATAENSGLESASVDLVIVAQALRWFDVDRFYAEVRRVLKSDGLVAVWCYDVVEIEGDEANHLLQHFYHQIVGPYWPVERHHVETGYRELPFPFTVIEAPQFAMRVAWTLEQLMDYLRSWSATERYKAACGIDPVAELQNQLGVMWSDASQNHLVSWPLSLRVGCMTE